MKKRILVYGDSNTWGSKAFGDRYDTDKQWPNILQELLGDDYEVIQGGLCGRIAGNHDTNDTHRNGRIGFEIIARSAAPFDYLIVALGTNDLKDKYKLGSEEIIKDLLWFEKRTEELIAKDSDFHPLKNVIYVGISNFQDSDYFQGSKQKVLDIHEGLLAIKKNLVIPDNIQHSADGLHYSENDHQKVAELVSKKFKEIENEV